MIHLWISNEKSKTILYVFNFIFPAQDVDVYLQLKTSVDIISKI